MEHPSGVLPAQSIERLIANQAIILGTAGLGARQLQPASLDLTLGKRAWRVRASFLPSPRRTVMDRLQGDLMMHPLSLVDGAVFERGCVYLVELRERLALPPAIRANANPKSSTGRIDVFVRLVTDHAHAFDEVPAGYDGPLYAEVSPRTFSILARTGSSLNQIRFKQGACIVSDTALKSHQAEAALSDTDALDIADGLGVRVSIAGQPGRRIGYRARRHSGLIDVDRTGILKAQDFFEPITSPQNGFIILDPDEFYILASREALRIPASMAAEMLPISPGLGEFRVHYAGFFDPGFGVEAPSRAVLEVRSHDAPFVLEDNYQGQGVRLSKHFAE